MSSAAAEYLATTASKTTGGGGAYGRGSRQRLMNLEVPEAAIAAIEKSRNVPTSIEWTSPRAGIVLERNAVEGMRVQPGGVLFRIADHSVIWRRSTARNAVWAQSPSVHQGPRRRGGFPGARSR